MGNRERNDQIKKQIIEAASEILASDGYELLSMRKIAKRIDYSPGIIYHYFKDKAEIVQTIVSEGYGNILKQIGQVPVDPMHPEETIVKGLTIYINMMLDIPEQFKAILMSNIEGIQDQVNILQRGISHHRKSIASMRQLIELGIKNGRFIDADSELTAQIIWTSTHGLLSRLVLETDISNEQIERLIDHHFKMMLNGLLK